MHAVLLPFLEQNQMFHAINFNRVSSTEQLSNSTVSYAATSFFWCPSDPIPASSYARPTLFPGFTNYAVNLGDDSDSRQLNGFMRNIYSEKLNTNKTQVVQRKDLPTRSHSKTKRVANPRGLAAVFLPLIKKNCTTKSPELIL